MVAQSFKKYKTSTKFVTENELMKESLKWDKKQNL